MIRLINSQKNEACRVDNDCVSPLCCIVGKCVRDPSGNGGPCQPPP